MCFALFLKFFIRKLKIRIFKIIFGYNFSPLVRLVLNDTCYVKKKKKSLQEARQF